MAITSNERICKFGTKNRLLRNIVGDTSRVYGLPYDKWRDWRQPNGIYEILIPCIRFNGTVFERDCGRTPNSREKSEEGEDSSGIFNSSSFAIVFFFV